MDGYFPFNVVWCDNWIAVDSMTFPHGWGGRIGTQRIESRHKTSLLMDGYDERWVQ